MLTVTTPDKHVRDMVWVQPQPNNYKYVFELMACHLAYISISTDSSTDYNYEVIFGYEQNQKSVLKDKEGTVSELHSLSFSL